MTKKTVFLTIVAMLMMVMVLPATASAKNKKKELWVDVHNLWEFDNFYEFRDTTKGQLNVTYGKKNVTKKVTYKSSNKKAFTVSKKGVIKMKGKGKATITIKYKGQKKKIKVQSHTHKWKKVRTTRPRATGEYWWYCKTCDGQHPYGCPFGHTDGYPVPIRQNVTFYVMQCGCCAEKPAPGYEDVYVPWDWENYDETYVYTPQY